MWVRMIKPSSNNSIWMGQVAEPQAAPYTKQTTSPRKSHKSVEDAKTIGTSRDDDEDTDKKTVTTTTVGTTKKLPPPPASTSESDDDEESDDESIQPEKKRKPLPSTPKTPGRSEGAKSKHTEPDESDSEDDSSEDDETTKKQKKQKKQLQEFHLTTVKELKNTDDKKIHVKNISRSATNAELTTYFEQFGTISFDNHFLQFFHFFL